MALQLLIVKEGTDEILAQKFFTKKRKVEKLRYEFSGSSIKAFTVSFVPRSNSLVIFIEPIKKEQSNG